ncbi:MAG: hypothetical protein QW279_16250 [Candidatus Jordarchaeaceae archaeon]
MLIRWAPATYDTYDRLPLIGKPTLILYGGENIMAPIRNAEILAERIPGAELIIYDNKGRIACPFRWRKMLKRARVPEKVCSGGRLSCCIMKVIWSCLVALF